MNRAQVKVLLYNCKQNTTSLSLLAGRTVVQPMKTGYLPVMFEVFWLGRKANKIYFLKKLHMFLFELSAKSVPCEHAYVNVQTRGDLHSLQWYQSPLRYFHQHKQDTKDLCSIHYASLNFRDVMLATGKLPPDAIPGDLANQECLLGMEFSGRDSDGNRVMGLVPAKVGCSYKNKSPMYRDKKNPLLFHYYEVWFINLLHALF